MSAFPAIAENNLILEESENSNSSDYEFYNSESEITVTTCETQEIQTETTTTTVFETESEETETTTTITDSGDSGDVDNGTGSGVYNENDIVTAVAKEAETGMKFSHWKDNANGNILSYNEKYVFYVSENTSIMAVYVETGTKVDAKGATNIVGLNQRDVSEGKGKLSFVSMSTIPIMAVKSTRLE